jgi:NhaP-type Na+/H+ and K+/H+ antiporter
MAPLVSLIVIITLSLLITRIAAEALVHTGLSREAARFQARSAFTGVGFTTHEAESIVNHPVRRKIIQALMLIGNVGIISAVASLILTFVDTGQGTLSNLWRFIIILASLATLWLLSKSSLLERGVARIINLALARFTDLNVKDYVEILNLTGEYEITVLKVREGDWMENRKLRELELNREGINLIAIQRGDDTFIGTPHGDTDIIKGDRLIIYGREKALQNLENRKEDDPGRKDHEKAIRDQEEELQKQEQREQSRKG